MRFCAAGSRVHGQAGAVARLRAARDACGVRRRRLEGDCVDKAWGHWDVQSSLARTEDNYLMYVILIGRNSDIYWAVSESSCRPQGKRVRLLSHWFLRIFLAKETDTWNLNGSMLKVKPTPYSLADTSPKHRGECRVAETGPGAGCRVFYYS